MSVWRGLDRLGPGPGSVLRLAELRQLLLARGANAIGSSALLTVLGYQVYDITGDPLMLGILGLVAGLPALALGLFGGHMADRRDRRRIILATSSGLAALVFLLAFVSFEATDATLPAIFVVVFLTGIASGFERPALSAFEAQVIPLDRATQGTAWVSSTGTAGNLIGPSLGGLAAAVVGVPMTYLLIAIVLLGSPIGIWRIPRKPMPPPEAGGSTLASIREGLRFVFRRQVLWGAMTLDLFAVLFGGVEALLPVFAADVLHVGPFGLGLLRTAPAVGALGILLVTTRWPPSRRAGPLFIGAVAGFGLSILVFALSTDFVLSIIALLTLGATDAVSVVIRSVSVRMYSPEHMRGRIASVSHLFIGASNEIGAFESGLAAHFLGAVPAVALGGAITLGVTGIVTVVAPELRRLDLREAASTAAELEAEAARTAI
ncbi:MAG: MFS transporter [Chloroflexi bacterium]|nr:MFS transporter [Chloroflexota bacterium]